MLARKIGITGILVLSVLTVVGGQGIAAESSGTATSISKVTVPLAQYGYGQLTAIVSAPDDSKILTASSDGNVRLWDAASGSVIRTFHGHSAQVNAVAFSPDMTKVLSGSSDKTARLWDLNTGELLYTFRRHSGSVRFVLFSPDGTKILTSSTDSAILWDLGSHGVLRTYKEPKRDITAVCFSPDGTQIAAGVYKSVILWDASTGETLKKLIGHEDVIQQIAFTLDGAQILGASFDKVGRVWDRVSGTLIRTFSNPSQSTSWYAMAFSPDRTKLVASGDNNTLVLWDTITGVMTTSLLTYNRPVDRVTFSSDGTCLLAGCLDALLVTRPIETGAVVQTYSGHTRSINTVSISPKGDFVVGGGEDNIVQAWDTLTDSWRYRCVGHSLSVLSSAVSPDASRILTGSKDDSAKVWNATTGALISTINGVESFGNKYAVAFSPDGKKALLGEDNAKASLWDIDTATLLKTFSAHTSWVCAAAFSPDGTKVATGAYTSDNTAKLWDVATGTDIKTFSGHTGAVNAVMFSPDGAKLLTASQDMTARLWDIDSGALLQTYSGHSASVNTVVFSPDGSMILTGSSDGKSILWNMDGTVRRTFSGHIGAVNAVAFSPDGKSMVSGGGDCRILRWATDGEITTASVPKLSGYTQSDAEKLITDAGLVLGKVSKEYSLIEETTRVITQTPEAGVAAPLGSSVDILISLGGVAAASVVGQTKKDAIDTIANSGLPLGEIKEEHSLVVNAGIVISQKPAAAELVFPDTPIDFVVSKGGLAVPNITGKTPEEAATILTNAGLVLGKVTEAYDTVAAVGNIASQSPKGGSLVLSGAQVDIVVSKGWVVVPNVLGCTLDNAEKLLEERQLSFGTVEERYDLIVPAGQIVSQIPVASVHKIPGDKVNVVVSLGCSITPDVVGLTEADAISALQANGFQVGGRLETYSITVPIGSVVLQSPAAGAPIFPGGTVVLGLSVGGLAVPRLVGETRAGAIEMATGTGFRIGAINEAYSLSVPEGVVIEQTPLSGSLALPDSPIDIVVSRGWAIVPKVVGESMDVGRSLITNAKLVVETVAEEYSLTVPKGLIITQNPAENSRVIPETSVQVTVSKGCASAPAIVGLGRSAAIAAITEAGLVPGEIKEDYSTTVPAGTIISQTPPGSSKVIPESSVSFVISLGGIVVPDVVGKDSESALADLSAIGLAPEKTEVYDLTVPQGMVISQDPVAAAVVLPASTVKVLVSLGAIVVPDVVGMPIKEAKPLIERAHLKVGTTTYRYDLDTPLNCVISQTPVGSSTVLSDVVVDLVVSRGAIETPDLVNQPLENADVLLAQANLVRGQVTEAYSVNVAAGKIISQIPAVHTPVLPQTSVDFVVSKGALEVPDIIGKTMVEAKKLLTAVLLSMGGMNEEYSLTIPAGRIIRQTPAAHRLLDAPQSVEVVVSRGSITVPEVVGQSLTEAETSITNALLALGTITRMYDISVPEGRIRSQKPSGNTPALPDTRIDLSVSLGGIAVPEVIGHTEEAAGDMLREHALGVHVTYRHDLTIPTGQVMSQDPEANVPALPGDVVDLVVSSGAITTPNVVGYTLETASNMLREALLALGAVSRIYSVTVPAESVISQAPEADVLVLPETPVDLTVSLGGIAVPEVRGLTQALAEASCIHRTLSIGVITRQCSDTVAAGLVISQTPAPKELVLPGAAVDMVVSSGPCPVTVPDVSGKPEKTASDTLSQAGLSIGTVARECNATIAEGVVIRHNPAGNQQVQPGTAVDMVVSSGVCTIPVPDLGGKPESTASDLLIQAGLSLGTVTRECSDSVAGGGVLHQSPTAEQAVTPGTAVNIVLSSGACTITVPDLSNMSANTAESLLAQAGLTVGATTFECSDSVSTGQVMRQDPAAGEILTLHGVVTLVVSTGACSHEGEAPVTPITLEEARTILIEHFAEIDTDQDGRITFLEARAFLAGLTMEMFEALGADSEGVLERDALLEDGKNGCSCRKSDFTPDALQKRVGDLFLIGLSLTMLLARRRFHG